MRTAVCGKRVALRGVARVLEEVQTIAGVEAVHKHQLRVLPASERHSTHRMSCGAIRVLQKRQSWSTSGSCCASPRSGRHGFPAARTAGTWRSRVCPPVQTLPARRRAWERRQQRLRSGSGLHASRTKRAGRTGSQRLVALSMHSACQCTQHDKCHDTAPHSHFAPVRDVAKVVRHSNASRQHSETSAKVQAGAAHSMGHATSR